MFGRGPAVLLLAVAWVMTPGVAMAQSSDDLFAQVFGNTAAAEPQSVALPVTADGRDAGDVGARVDIAAGTALVNAAELVDVLFRFIEPETAQALIDGADAEGYLDEAAIAASGITSVFDPSNLRLAVTVPASLRPTLDLSLRGDYQTGAVDDFVPRADVSGYINMFTGLDFVTTDSSNAPGGTGRQPISTAFEGVISALGGVIQGELNYQQDDDRPWQRGDVRAIFDNQATAVRTTIGDLNYPLTGFQGFVPMAGFSNARDFDIQPYTVVQPAGSQQLLLENDSTVDVMVNGRQVDSLDLPAGPYTLSDFPVAAGANDIVLQVRDRFGRVNEIVFNQFYDGSLLAPGLSEYTIAGGMPSSRQDGLYRYDDRTPSFTGFYREGISDDLTLGGNLQGSKEVVMGGGELRVATLFGNFLIEPAASWADGRGVDGALNLQNEYYQPLGDSYLGDRLWNFAAILRGTDFAQLGNPQGTNPVSLQLAARMSQLLTEDLSLSLSGRYGFSRESGRDDTNNITILLRRRLWTGASLDLTLERDDGSDGIIGNSAFLSLRIPLGGNQTFRSTWDTSNHELELRWTDRPPNSMNAIATDLAVDHSDQGAGASGNFDYRNQRFDASLLLDANNPYLDGGTRQRSAEFDFSTALVFADGHYAVTRPVSDSFAIVVPHENLEGYVIGLNPNDGTYQAEIDWMGPAVLPDFGSYELNTVVIEVPDLPFGYDLGDETPTVLPTLTSGAVVVVGTDATVLLGGTLADNLGQPLVLEAGSTPAIREKAMASGIRARATTVPASRSRRGLASHCRRAEAIRVMSGFHLDEPRPRCGFRRFGFPADRRRG